MATVAVLPTPLARAALAGANPRNAGTCGIYDIAGRLGQAHRRPAYICATIDALIRTDGFPKPYPLGRGAGLLRDVHADSRWPRAVVELWFDNQLPEAARAVLRNADRAGVDSRLHTNLRGLFDGDAA